MKGYYDLGEAQTALEQDQPWESTPPHKFSVIEGLSREYRYWGYYGLVNHKGNGGIGMAQSNDLERWDKSVFNPLLNNGEGWPSVRRDGQDVYMAHTRDYGHSPANIALRMSRDGFDFGRRDDFTLLVAPEAGKRNQNPHLFRDPNDGRHYLYWCGGDVNGTWQIKVKGADTIEGLAIACRQTLIEGPPDYAIAAPAMFYHDGIYFLSTEIHPRGRPWQVAVCTSKSPRGTFAPLGNGPVLDNAACYSSRIFDGILHSFYCCERGMGGWVVDHRVASLSRA